MRPSQPARRAARDRSASRGWRVVACQLRPIWKFRNQSLDTRPESCINVCYEDAAHEGPGRDELKGLPGLKVLFGVGEKIGQCGDCRRRKVVRFLKILFASCLESRIKCYTSICGLSHPLVLMVREHSEGTTSMVDGPKANRHMVFFRLHAMSAREFAAGPGRKVGSGGGTACPRRAEHPSVVLDSPPDPAFPGFLVPQLLMEGVPAEETQVSRPTAPRAWSLRTTRTLTDPACSHSRTAPQ